MTNEETIKVLGGMRNLLTDQDGRPISDVWYALGIAIEALSAQPEQRWIPCSEGLPEEKEEDYWICTNIGYQCQCRWTNKKYGFGISQEWGWRLFDIPKYTHVIAWQPLPEPYNEDMRGEE